jgi:hypothetical protein
MGNKDTHSIKAFVGGDPPGRFRRPVHVNTVESINSVTHCTNQKTIGKLTTGVLDSGDELI